MKIHYNVYKVYNIVNRMRHYLQAKLAEICEKPYILSTFPEKSYQTSFLVMAILSMEPEIQIKISLGLLS